MWKLLRTATTRASMTRCSLSDSTSNAADELWKDPWKKALPPRTATETSFEEVPVDWEFVKRLLPKKTIPVPPPRNHYPTPSGWRPPQDPPPDLPYRVRRSRFHTFELFLETRRDLLNEKTIDFDYVELVVVRNVQDLREYLEKELGHPVATHVDELKGRIKVKGADRSLIEKFLFNKGF